MNLPACDTPRCHGLHTMNINTVGDFTNRFPVHLREGGEWRVCKKQHKHDVRGRDLQVIPLIENLRWGLAWCVHPDGSAFEVRLENLLKYKPIAEINWSGWEGEEDKPKKPREKKVKETEQEFIARMVRQYADES